MSSSWISDLIGTAQSYFRIGFSGVRLKDVAGNLQVRNSGDTADANLKASLLQLSGGSPALNKVLMSDASGNGAWGDIGAVAEHVNQEAFTQATTSPLTIFTPANGEIITRVILEVTTAAAGGSPTASVGVAGTVGAYMATTENNLKEVGVYEVTPMVVNAAAAVILTLVPSAQTFVGKVTFFSTIPA